MVKLELLIVFGLMLILVSCTKINNSNELKVGLLLPNLSDARYPKDRDFFVKKIDQLGGTTVFGDAHNDPVQQERQAKKMINDGVKLLVISSVNQNLAASIVRYAHAHDIRVIGYERLIQNCKLDYFVAYDHYMVGKQQAAYAVKRKPAGNYVIIGGDKSDENAELIKRGQHDVISPFVKLHKISVLYDIFVEDWDSETAYQEMCRVLNLSTKKVDVVLAANDGMAEGIIRALNELQPGYPALVTGLDADITACHRILQGKQSMTVYKSFKNQAEIAAKQAISMIRNQNPSKTNLTTFNGASNVPTILLQPLPIDNSNLRSTLIKDMYLKKSDLL